MDINILVKLTSKAWSLRALALMYQGVPGRQAPLIAASGASRTTFVNSLHHLEELGLLERNPGHGHPLRPEFRLTEKGLAFAPVAHRIDAAARDERGAILLRRAWTVPLLAVVHRPMQFSQIKREIVPITDRALSVTLRQLQAQRWIERSVDVATHPPRPLYLVANEGAEINRAIGLAI